MAKKNILFAGYFPVLHKGYIEAFLRHPDATIGIFDAEVIAKYAPYLRKDIRALQPKEALSVINGLGRDAKIIGFVDLEKSLVSPIIMPNDDITRIIKRHYPHAKISTESVFLRWDRDNSTELQTITPDRTIELGDDDPIIKLLNSEISKSTNWWRHVGAVIIDESSKVILSNHNSSVPTEYSSLIDCDPRITAKRGESIDRSIDIHAEAHAIASASNQGIKTAGCSIYVSTFPCPSCAKLIAYSGIKRCYYASGYAMLDGLSVLQDFGIEVVKINSEFEPEDSNTLKPYPASQS